MRVRFDAHLCVRSQKGVFPSNTVAMVYVTNRDGCSYQEAPVSPEGLLRVNFHMRPLQEQVRLTDRLKFHFFFRDNSDQQLKPICSQHISLEGLIERVRTGREPTRTQCNFNSNTMEMRFVCNEEYGQAMHRDLARLSRFKALAPSVLGVNTADFIQQLQRLDSSIKEGLQANTDVREDNGGNMFQTLFTAHTMENEATLYTLYHHDFDAPHNVPPWLCTYLLGETLHHNAVTPEQVRMMPPEQITRFIGSYAQAPMRSATATPYTNDLILNEDPQFVRTRQCTMLSEVFKRPFSHPHNTPPEGDTHGSLINDDCEGLAALMRDLTNHLGYLHSEHGDDLRPIIAARGRGASSTLLAGNTLMQAYFPEDLFAPMPVAYRARLMSLALHLGEYIASGQIECSITLASAMGASFGSEGNSVKREIQAHACASLVCNVPGHPSAMVLEGTACMADDHLYAAGKRIKVADKYVPLTDVANSLNHIVGIHNVAREGLKTKVAMHITHSKGSFYRTAFCQNGTILASQIGSSPMQYGVEMEHLADDSIKIHLPVTGRALGGEKAHARLEAYVRARSVEIHPPLVDHTQLRSKLNWAPMTPFLGCDLLNPDRPYLTCMMHVASDRKVSTDELLARATAEAEAFNRAKEHSTALGVMRAVATMDGVSKLFHFYTDDLTLLQSSLHVETPKTTAA